MADDGRMAEHARHILTTLGFNGEQVEIQTPILATYLQVYVAAQVPTEQETQAAVKWLHEKFEYWDRRDPDVLTRAGMSWLS